MSFVLIVKRPNNYIFNNVENAILTFQNKYSLGQPFILYNNQIVLLQKIGYNYLTRPENFGAFGERYILIFFTTGNTIINQYFYKDSFLSQNGIFFNALNNYDIDYVYTNVATPIRSYTNTLEYIYSVQGIPLSFIDDTNIQYAYTRPHGVTLLKSGVDPYIKGAQSFPYKDTRNGQRYITDGYNKALMFAEPAYNPSFDKLIIYNRGNFCGYLLMNGTNFNGAPPFSIDTKLFGCLSLTNNNSFIPKVNPKIFLENDPPQIFDLPASFAMEFKYAEYLPGQQIIIGGQVLVNSQSQLVGSEASGSEWDFDLIEKASSTLCGNNNLIFSYQEDSDPRRRSKYGTPKRAIKKTDLLENSEFNMVSFTITTSIAGRATFRYDWPINYQYPLARYGTYEQYYTDEFTTTPDQVYTYSNKTGIWTVRGYSATKMLLEDLNVFQWTRTKYDNFLSFEVPSNSDKTTTIFHNSYRDFIGPSAYLLKNINRVIQEQDFDVESIYTGMDVWGIRARKINEYSIFDNINIGSYFPVKLQDSNAKWQNAPIDPDFIRGTIPGCLSLRNFQPLKNTDTVDYNFYELLEPQLETNFENFEKSKTTSHAIDDKPFSLGIRMMRNSFNYKNYFQFRHFPKLILKKTFELPYGMSDILPSVITTETFNLNSLLVKNYNQVACFLLPCYSKDLIENGSRRGISIKCSLAKTIRGIGQFLYLERGKSFDINFQKFINASTFNFEIYCPQVIASSSTLYRNINSSRFVSIYLIFK